MTTLEKEIKDQQISVVQLKQYPWNCNLDVRGIPELENESVFQLISKVGTLAGKNVTMDVSACHCVLAKEPGKMNLIMQFQNRDKRDAHLPNLRRKHLSMSDLGMTPQTSIFVNVHLCPTKQTARKGYSRM